MQSFILAAIAAVGFAGTCDAQNNSQNQDTRFRSAMQNEQNYNRDIVVQETQRAFRENLEQAMDAFARHDYATARRLWQVAADAGLPFAEYSLGRLCQQGRGGPKDTVQAVKLFHKAAEAKFGPAEFSLGMIYLTGAGEAKDDQVGAKWVRRAADHHVAQAMFNLGVLYENGQGLPQDARLAADWYQKAATAGVK